MSERSVYDDIIRLTNGIPYANTNSGGTSTNDYYVYDVTTNAVRAQFEINGPTAPLTLVARKGLPVVIVNPTAPVGPRDVKPTPTGQVIQQGSPVTIAFAG